MLVHFLLVISILALIFCLWISFKPYIIHVIETIRITLRFNYRNILDAPYVKIIVIIKINLNGLHLRFIENFVIKINIENVNTKI